MHEYSLIDRIPIGLFMITSDFRIVFWNACFEDWTGIEKATVQGKDVREIFPRLKELRYQSRLTQLFEDGLPFVLSYQLNGDLFSSNSITHKDRVHHCTITSMPSQGGNSEALAIFAIEDRTEVAMRTKVARVELLMRYEVEKELRKALDEKVMLMNELNHRVKNNLNMIESLISLQYDSCTDSGFQGILRDLEGKITSISLLHEMLYKTDIDENISLDKYLEMLCRNICTTFLPEGTGVTLALRLAPAGATMDQTLHIGLITSELLTNALKYGINSRVSGLVSVVLSAAEAGVVLTVGDDGAGLPPDFEVGKSSSLGMKLVYMMTKQLKGSLEIIRGSKELPGANYRLFVPYAAERARL